MSCDEIQPLLNADVDRQLDDESRPMLEAHLASCADCRAARESLAALDAALVRGLRPLRARADDVAERTIARLRSQTRPAPSGSARRWIGYLLAVAGGYVLAVFLSRPLPPSGVPESGPVARHPHPDAPGTAPQPPVIATIVALTGPVQVRRPPEQAWVSVEVPSFTCPTDTSIRTSESTLCELQTDGGCRIRMDAGTEVDLKSGNEVHIAGGQLWCQAPDTSQMKIVAKGSPQPHPVSTSAACTVNWSGPGSLMTACDAEQPLTIAADSGTIEIVTATETRQLRAGDSAQVIGDDVRAANRSFEPLLDASWMHPLLVQKGFADSELNERVNGLLAQLGRAKMSFLFERDIRGLGEYSALPLLRFVESTLSEDDADRRRQAASILADVAPAWMVPDLLALLSDDHPDVRVAAARGLTRLTGQSQGLRPEQWHDSRDQWSDAHDRWLAWWDENRRAYATRPLGVGPARKLTTDIEPKQMLKARK